MSGVLRDLPIVLILVAGVCAPVAGWLATRRYRKAVSWFVLGAVLGPLALILLAAAPPGRCPNCETVVDGWPTWCDACGARVRDGWMPAARPALPSPVITRQPRAVGPGRTEQIEVMAGQLRRPLTSSIVERASIVTPPTPIDTARGARREPRSTRTALSRPSRADGRQSVAMPMPTTPPAITASNYEIATSTTEATGDVLSTGVYISGNAGLEIGACYAIARDGDHLRVFGPVDAGQLTIRHEGPISDFDVTAMDDRVIIAGREGRSSLAIVFRTIGGMQAADLESALAPSAVGFGGRR